MKKKYLIITCLSIFQLKLTVTEYESDMGKIKGILTNEAGTKYLMRRIKQELGNRNEKPEIVIIMLVSKKVQKFKYEVKSINQNITSDSDIVSDTVEMKEKREKFKTFLKNPSNEAYQEKLKKFSIDPVSEKQYFEEQIKQEYIELFSDNKAEDKKLVFCTIEIEDSSKKEPDLFGKWFKTINDLKENCRLEIYMDESGGQRDMNYQFN